MTAGRRPARAVDQPSRPAARLSEYAVGRDNNFNLIRLMAALSVLFSHSVAALGLPSSREFFFDHLGLSLAEMAVDVFFVTSGFLVAGSLVNRGDVIAFLWARALRIYPAIWVMLILTVFVLAPALTTLPLADYFASPKTHDYFVKCATLIGGVRYSLPGVFETMPLHGEFNGSLWTLPIELRLYCYLAAGWLVLAAAPAIRMRAMSVAAPIVACAYLVLILRGRLFGAPFNAADTRIFMFLYGTTLYLWRDRVPMSPGILFAALACLLIASVNEQAFFVVYVVSLAPLVLHLAYLPKGRVLAFNDWGDCSYGVYIYAFPIQQTLAFLFPGMPLIAMILVSAAITLGVAALSWTLVERRALALKGDFAAATSRAFNLGLAKIAGVVR
ncbi:acyltransferase family protein [Roseiarcus sp.]|uniref:acyltransferase family protein n=1 Tax=Roseiarcus sp. TaxID=1969460 RepID=UPI003D1445A2